MWRQTPIELKAAELAAICAGISGDVCWFDSAIGEPGRGDRTLLTLELQPALLTDNSNATVFAANGSTQWSGETSAAWTALDAQLARDISEYRLEGWPAAVVGYASYESSRFCDAAINTAPDALPPLRWDYVLAALLVDKGEASLITRSTSDKSAAERLKEWREALPDLKGYRLPEPTSPTLVEDAAPAKHARQVEEILSAIRSGRYYQACLTYPVIFQRPETSLLPTYWAMRERSPGDYGGYFRWGDLEVASSSPEEFLQFEGLRVRARPMKGTRKRGPGPPEILAEELRNHPKDRAENIMIVDLLRNDLGRSCKPGTVVVDELCAIETYETVLQMTSTVSGKLRDDVGYLEAFRRALPPGSMTGAPKVEACNHLVELEQTARGVYSGSIGWIGYDKRAVFSVVIRSFQAWGDTMRWHTGGGIVSDSVPEEEWDETRAKIVAGYPTVDDR
jgi:anthranilate/para-aminobenzoate synthase component I